MAVSELFWHFGSGGGSGGGVCSGLFWPVLACLPAVWAA